MGAFKKLNKQDYFVTSYSAKKSWIASGSDYGNLGIQNLVGLSGSGAYIPNDGDIQKGQYRRLVFNSIHHLYYSLFNKSGEIVTTGSFENYLPSSLIPTLSRTQETRFAVFSLPRDIVGTHIEPKSVYIIPDAAGDTDNYVLNGYASEDGKNLYIEDINNLYGATFPLTDFDYIENESKYVQETDPLPGEYLDIEGPDQYSTPILDDGEGNLYLEGAHPKRYVGNVVYSHGLIIITEDIIANYFNNYFNARMKWKSNQPILTHNYLCKVRSSEFNHTLNRTAMSGSNGDLALNVSGEQFQPYITTVGLYNDSNELIAVAKLSQPLPKSNDTDMVIQVRLDMR